MTNKSFILAASLAAVVFTSSAFASSSTCRDNVAGAPLPRPVASSVVKPTGLPMEFAGTIVDVEFALDQTGQPRDIKVLGVSDTVLKRQLVAAFRHWRFEPGVNAPATSPKRFILPIQLNPEV